MSLNQLDRQTINHEKNKSFLTVNDLRIIVKETELLNDQIDDEYLDSSDGKSAEERLELRKKCNKENY